MRRIETSIPRPLGNSTFNGVEARTVTAEFHYQHVSHKSIIYYIKECSQIMSTPLKNQLNSYMFNIQFENKHRYLHNTRSVSDLNVLNF